MLLAGEKGAAPQRETRLAKQGGPWGAKGEVWGVERTVGACAQVGGSWEELRPAVEWKETERGHVSPGSTWALVVAWMSPPGASSLAWVLQRLLPITLQCLTRGCWYWKLEVGAGACRVRGGGEGQLRVGGDLGGARNGA